MAVAVGGAVGALARAGLSALVPHDDGFPWTTFALNVSGSLLLALLVTLAAVRTHPVLVAGLGPGLLGGFTTLSTYAEETRVLVADGRPVLAAAYVVGTLAACLLAVALVHRVRSHPRPGTTA